MILIVSEVTELPAGVKHFGDGLVSMFEDIRYLAFDEKICDVAERFERQAVTHFVLHQRFARLDLGEAVLMYPLFVRAGKLCIFKEVRRFPTRDLGPPLQRKSVQRQFVINKRALPHLKRRRRYYGKAKLRRRNAFQIFGI